MLLHIRYSFLILFLTLHVAVSLADNPLIPGIGMCDSHIRIFEGKAYLYSGHDADPAAKTYIMPDWRIYSSDDLVNWKHERTVYPEETYLGKGNTRCYATDAAYRNGFYYFYFSNGKDHTAGVLRGRQPAGPYEDPLKKPLLYPELTPMDAEHDPTIFFDDDKNQTPYIIFGRSKDEPFHIARLNEDMISLAETPRPIASKGYASDQNFLFKRNGIYYLSFTNNRYVTATNIYGPYSSKTKSAGGNGGHGSYFSWNNQWYRTTNNRDTIHHFRKTLMTYVHFKRNGDMVNDPEFYQTGYAYSFGVGQYNAAWPKIQAEWYFASEGVEKTDNEQGEFEIQQINHGNWLKFPKLKNMQANTKISFRVSSASQKGGLIEIREGAKNGRLLGQCLVPATKSWNTYDTVSCRLNNEAKTQDLYLVFKGKGAELMRLDWFALNQPDTVKATDKFREHPRLFFLKDEENALKQKIATDKRLKGVHELIIAESRRMISLPLLTRNQVGRRILHTSREAIRRITFLAYAHRMTGEKGFAERAKAEMFNLAAFENWNPTHFLDVAEMTMAVAIGYDWLYDNLSKEERTKIEAAIQVLGIEPSTETRYNKWLKNTNNWNQVCNGGISAGAVATFENNKSANAALLNRAISSLPLAMHEYSDHGGYPEGYHYWDYGTSYNLLLLDMLTQNTGTDAGLKAQRGFLETGTFMQQLEGNVLKSDKKQAATPLCFNYADCSDETSVNPAMFWFASETGNASLLYRELQKLETGLQIRPEKLSANRFLPMLLLWSLKVDFSKVTIPERKMFVANGKTEIAVMRSSWTDSTAIYVGVKAGTPSASHQHMDVGSFIMEANGVRWAMDFGLQEYNSLETKGVDLWNRNQNSQRWDVFRYKNSSHNTLTINNKKQLVSGNAIIKSISETENNMSVSVDLTSIYVNAAKKVERKISLQNNKMVQTEDLITTFDNETSVRWNMLTQAAPVIIDNHTIQLTQDGKMLYIKLNDMEGAKAYINSTVSPNEYDAPNTGTTFIGFDIKIPANTSKKIIVNITFQNNIHE